MISGEGEVKTDAANGITTASYDVIVGYDPRKARLGVKAGAVALAVMTGFAIYGGIDASSARQALVRENDTTCTALKSAISTDAGRAAESLAWALHEDTRGTTVEIDPDTKQIQLVRRSETREPATYKPGGTRVVSFIAGMTFFNEKNGYRIMVFGEDSVETVTPGAEYPEFHGFTSTSVELTSGNNAEANKMAAQIEAAAAANNTAALASAFTNAIGSYDSVGNDAPSPFKPEKVTLGDIEGAEEYLTNDCASDLVTRDRLLWVTTQGEKVQSYVSSNLVAKPVG